MKVIGLGSPDDIRVRFAAGEIDVLVDVLRDQRAKATRDAADTYATTPPGQTRPIDDRHDRLRGHASVGAPLELKGVRQQTRPVARVLPSASVCLKRVEPVGPEHLGRRRPRRPFE